MSEQLDKDAQAQKALIRRQSMAQFLANAPAKDKGIGGYARDAGLSLLSGAVSVPETVVGLADIATGGQVGKALENEGGMFGFRPKETKEAIAGWKTEKSQKQLQGFQDTEGFGGKLGYAASNPSLIANTVLESLPAMGAGGVVGRGLGLAAKGLSPVAAGALGEGAVGAGLAGEQIRQQTADGLLTNKQAGLAAATGATTAGFGFAGGKLAKQLGIADFDTSLVSGNLAGRTAAEIAEGTAKQPGIIKRVAGGALGEGLLEELPQSVSETILQNEALGKPLDEGVTDAAALGLLSGAAMGGFAGGMTRNRQAVDDITPTEDMGQEAPRLGLPNPNRPGGNQLGYQGAVSDPNNPNWIEDGNPDYFNRGQGPNAANMRNLTPDPELTYNSELGGQFSATQDGTVFSEAEYNDYLAQQQAQARATRDAGMSDVNDITPIPEGYEQSGNDPRLPAPRSDFEVTPDGTARTSVDSNTVMQNERAANAERLASRLRGDIQDNTPVPNEAMAFGNVEPVDNRKLSERMGLDPNKGGLSAAAAIAVDSGASPAATQMAGLLEVEAQSQPTGSKWLQGMRTRLENVDIDDEGYQSLSQAIESDPKSVPERMRLTRQIETLPQKPEPIAKRINPKARIIDEAKAQSVAYNPKGDKIPLQFDVVDASELLSSHSNNFVENPNYPQQYQPRDRAEVGYQAQVLDIVKNFNPELLGKDNSVNAGSPIVGRDDNLVESGNGRTIAIRRMYESGKGDAYRQFVNKSAEEFGLDTNAVNQMRQPVLVRRNNSDMDREQFALRANAPTGAAMSSSERAKADAKILPNAELLELDSNGSLNLKGSYKFTQAFIGSLDKNEVNELVLSNGELSQTGQNRVSGALLQNAYGSSKLTKAVTEDIDSSAKNVLKTLVDKAPQITKINQSIKQGDREADTLSEDIKTAAETYIDLVESGANIDDYLNMEDMFGEGISQQSKDIVRDFYSNARSATRMGSRLQARIDAANRVNTPDLLADFETDAPNVLSNEPAPSNTQAATQLTDENPTVNIPAPRQTRPKVESTEPPVRDVSIGEWVDGMNKAIDSNLAKRKNGGAKTNLPADTTEVSAGQTVKNRSVKDIAQSYEPNASRVSQLEEKLKGVQDVARLAGVKINTTAKYYQEAYDDAVKTGSKNPNKTYIKGRGTATSDYSIAAAEAAGAIEFAKNDNTEDRRSRDLAREKVETARKLKDQEEERRQAEKKESESNEANLVKDTFGLSLDEIKNLVYRPYNKLEAKAKRSKDVQDEKNADRALRKARQDIFDIEDAVIDYAKGDMDADEFLTSKAGEISELAAVVKPPQSSVAKVETAPALRQLDATGRAKDGKGINAGEQFQTATNRETTPYPKQKSERYASQWLIDNAVAEAEARGNKFAARQFANTDIQKGGYLNTADAEGMQQYLFDESSTVADVKVTSLKDMAEANEQETIAPKASEMKFSRAAGMSEKAELKDLLVVHNITSKGVLAAAELGGLAAPSIAVIRSEISDFTGYGEITLIADPLFITGKDMPTYDADIYSPRQPRAQNDINRKRFDAYEESLAGTKYGLRFTDLRSLEMSDGEYQFMRSPAVQYQFLESIGKIPKLKNKATDPLVKKAAKLKASRYDLFDDAKFRSVYNDYAKEKISRALEIDAKRKGFETAASQEDVDFFNSIYFNEDGSANRDALRKFYDSVISYRESDGKDFNQLKSDISEKMRSPLMQRRYEKWAGEQFNNLSDGKRLPNGETRSGARKYKPYNLENVVKEMTRELNNGESFNYGAGNVRSVYAGELKTLTDIKAKRDKIISKEDFAVIKEESNKVFSDALDSLKPYYKYDADSWNYDNDVSSAIAEGATGIREAFGASKEAKKIIDDLTYYLSNLPTEYFEAKAQRAVQFGEFDTAIVSKDTDPEAVKVLRDAGVKIKRFDSKVDGDRNRVLAQQTKLMFSKPESDRTTGTPTEKVKGSTNTTRQQVIGKLNDKFGKETIDKLMADGKLDIKVLSDFVRNGKLTIPSDVDGLYHNGKATLIADNLSDDMIIPTFLHELGGHGGMQSLMDKKAYNALMKDFDALVKAGDPLAMQAKAMADKVARNEQDALDEYLPYLITLTSRQQAKTGKVAGMINRMVMAIRSWLKNTLGVPIAINSQDILSLAERMVNEVEKQGSTLDATNAVPQFSDPNIPDKQMQDVRAQYENTDQWMTAPNGKPTNLTENQWVQTRTPAFKEWFGDWQNDPKNASKIVDDNGEPLILYRGDNTLWNEYDLEKQGSNSGDKGLYGQGVYLTPNASEALDYGSNVRSFYANGRNLLNLTNWRKEPIANELLMELATNTKRFTLPKGYSYADFKKEAAATKESIKAANPDITSGELSIEASDNMSKKYRNKDAWFTGDQLKMDYTLEDFGANNVSELLQSLGYDGAIGKSTMRYGTNDMEYMLPITSQVKSATDNVGTFDPNNNDIRYSQGADGMKFSRAAGMTDEFDPINMARESKQRLYDWASSAPPGKLSWWHKTLGTMYNLSQRNPYFKPVYQSTEKFINDVSFYASKASEFAPRLLPQLDSLRDIGKSAIGAKDNEALSKPIFEGTLLWGRDLDGKAVLIEDWRKKVMAASKQDRLQMLRDANRITPAQLQQLATLNNIQANRFINGIIDDEVNAGLVWTDAELQSKFDLSDEQIGLYREFRATTDNSLDSMTRSDMLRRLGKDAAAIETAVMEAGTLREAVFNIEQHINDLIQASPKKEKSLRNTLKDIKESKFRTDKLMDDGYAPLSRFGQYTVDVVDADGNREYFGMFESAYEARKMKAEMDALYGNDDDFTVTQGALSKEEFKLFAGVTPETAELFGEMMGLDATGDKAADDAFQEYLRRTKNNRSTMKRLMHRKGIKGYSEDVGRVLASFVYSNARHTSAALNMGNLDRSIQDIPKGEGQLKDAAVKLAQYIKNPQEEGQLIRGWMFAQYLGGSIASAVVNITQPLAVSFPYLSQYGGAVKAANQLRKSSADWTKALIDKSRDHFEAGLKEAIERAEADGTLSPQEVHNLLRQASGKNPLSAGDGTKVGDAKALASNTLSRVSLAWGSLFSAAEQVNRRVTFVAAYRMAVDQGMDNPAEFATNSIKETQFVYNKASRMNWGRGAVGGTLMTFKTYTVSYMELMHRLWTQGEKGSPERQAGRKAVGIMLGTLFLLGGAGGLPFMEDAEDLVDGIGQIMGYNFSSKKVRQDFLDEWVGEMMGDFIDGGISSMSGSPTDVSGRLGLGNLIPGTGVFKERTSNSRDVLELAGPAGDFVGRVATGTRSIAKGIAGLDSNELKRGALEFAPTAVRNAVKGAGMATSGIYKDTKGYKVADVSPIDAAFKFVGFQPRDISKIQEANYLGQSSTSYYNLRASNIRALWAAGVNEGNQSKVADAKAAVKDWNEKNPDQKIVVKPNDIARRVREMRMDKSDRVVKRAPKSARGVLSQDLAKASQ